MTATTLMLCLKQWRKHLRYGLKRRNPTCVVRGKNIGGISYACEGRHWASAPSSEGVYAIVSRDAIGSVIFLALTALSLGSVHPPVWADPVPMPNAAGVYNVRAFGAKGDGVILDSPAIDRAITAASAAGGGTVFLPAGTYLCVSVHLKSNITLSLGQGATIEAASPTDGPAYDPPEPTPEAGAYEDFGHRHWHNSLIWGEGLQNVAILGPGRIWGRGLVREDDGPDGRGNKAISLKLCRNVTLRDVVIQHGGWFGILATGVDNLTIDNLTIDTNRDGMDIDCCRNVHVSNCSVNSPRDDGICLKSSYGLGFARATENVTITNCQVSGFDEGTFLDGTFRQTNPGAIGRIKFGTESNGGFREITIANCVFTHCLGLALEEVDGGLLDDVSISNLTMRDIGNAPIYLRLGGRLRGPAGTTMGALRRVSISHVTVYNAAPGSAVIVAGVPDGEIEDVTLSDIRLWYKGGGTKSQAARIPPEDEKGYPEPSSFGVLPAYGFYLRHVRGITLDNIQMHFLADDFRPAFVLSDVARADFQRVQAQHLPDAPIFALTDVTNLRVHDTDGLPDTQKDHVEQGNL